MYTHPLLRIIKIINLIMMLLILVSVYGTYQAMQETNENMKMYVCDGYAYDISSAPAYCQNK